MVGWGDASFMIESPRPADTANRPAPARSQVDAVPAWADSLLASLGLDRQSPVGVVYEKTNELATRLAPNTRRLWRSILILEGIAVLLPIGWLMVSQRNWPAAPLAGAVAVCTIALVGVCWWLRWRSQQQSWSRSRLLAEITRSLMATSGWSGHPTRGALGTAPALQPLSEWFERPEPTVKDWPDLRQAYLADRIEDQSRYYESKAGEAAADRRRLSLYVTRSLDGALFLAVLGLWLGFSDKMRWVLSVFETDLILGLAGAVLPLTAILMQSLSVYLELNRRTGRYAQQWEFLQANHDRLRAAGTEEEATAIVREVEQALLAETAEWFYQAEHAEVFYRTRSTPEVTPRLALTAAPESPATRVVSAVLSAAGLALGFTARIIFGRLLIAAVASVLTALLIFSRAPQDAVQRSLLRTADGQLLSKPGRFGWWNPKPEEAAVGFVLIAHGLHDAPRLTRDGKPAEPDEEGKSHFSSNLHWMGALQEAMRERYSVDQGASPDICLVDWSLAARPSDVSGLLSSVTTDATLGQFANQARFVTDVTAIRTQAQAIGDTVGYKLAGAMQATPPVLHRDRPMHLIGHSAGGFLVVRAALVLQQLGLLPEHTRITMLDTPLPDVNDIDRLLLHDGSPTSVQLDYYKSSGFAQGVPDEKPAWPNYRCLTLTPPEPHNKTMTAAHSYAHQWFIRSVTDPSPDAASGGFQWSPLLRKK